MKNTKNIMQGLAICVIAIFIIAVMANCVSAKRSYGKADETTKDYYDKIKQGFVDGNDKAKINLKGVQTKEV